MLGTPAAAQMGRATITGIVKDATGAVVPAVTVTATHVETQVTTTTATNEVGNYTITSLPIGQYTVAYKASGFKEHTRSGLSLVSGQIARLDIELELGQVSERVTVAAEAALLETETAQTSESVNASVFKDLPLNFGGGRNMAKFADKLVPGVYGEYWTMKVQGTPSATQSIVIDGMSNLGGMLPGDFGEDSISPEAVQELTVFTGNQTAEFGRTGGGTLNMVLKSGANEIHGSGFYYLQNEALNANSWANNLQLARNPNDSRFRRPLNRQKTYGGSFGGPIYIPKVYDGRNKTFFYLTLEQFKTNNTGPTTLQITAPQPEMLDGNFSKLLGQVIATDPLGRPVAEGQLYDPATLRQVSGSFVSDPFLGNLIPASRVSQVARNMKSTFLDHYQPAVSALTNNMYGTSRYMQDVEQGTLKLDHTITSNHKLSGYLYWNGFPRYFPRGSPTLWSLADQVTGGPLSRYAVQHRRANGWNANYDWIMSPTLLNHFSFGHNVQWSQDIDSRLGEKWHEKWGIKGVPTPGVAEGEIPGTGFTFGASPVMSIPDVLVNPWNTRTKFNTYILNDTMTWQHSKHTIKFGFEWMRHGAPQYAGANMAGTFEFQARTTAIPGYSYTSRIGNAFASFILGEVNSASRGVLTEPNVSRHSYGAFFQDSWKVTSRLTLNVGVRWNADTPILEVQDRMANFSPTLIDPTVGLPGAVEFMGVGQGRAGRRNIADGYYKGFGPNFGFAYRITDRLVARGGYGLTYTPESITTAHKWGPIAFSGGTFPFNNVPADSKGQFRPVFNIDNGYPGQDQQPVLDPSYGLTRGVTRMAPETYWPGYVQHFNFGLQYQLTGTTVLEADWRASKGTRLRAGDDVYPNQIRREELARGDVLGQIIDTPQKAAAAGLPYPYPGFNGTGAHTLQPFPHLKNNAVSAWGDPVGFSNYHAGNIMLTKRFSKGITAYGAYTFAKSISNIDNSGIIGNGDGAGVGDSYNRPYYKAIDPYDRTHVYKVAVTYDLPFGKGRPFLANAHPVVNAIAGGWNIAAIMNYASGMPLRAPTSRTRPTGWNGPGVLANFNTPAGGFNRIFDTSKFNPWAPADPTNRFFDPAAFSDAPRTDLGSSPIRFPTMRMLWSLNEDVTVMKRFAITERVRLELRVEFFNFFNRHYFGAPDTNMFNTTFGNVRTADGNRQGQAGVRLDW